MGDGQISRRTVNTDAELNQALSEIEGYFDTPPEPSSKEARTFDRLAKAIADFEDKAYPASASK